MVLWRTNLLGWVNITETVGQFHRNIQGWTRRSGEKYTIGNALEKGMGGD